MELRKLPAFVTSDSHWFHSNIIQYAKRPFDHERMMLKRWRTTIKEDDVVLHLGDVFFGGDHGYERYKEEVAPKLPGRKLLVLGNHDKRRYDWKALGFEVVKPFEAHYRGFLITFSHYPKFIDGRHLHVHGHIHNHPYAQGEMWRPGNINVSVEKTDYYPRRVTRLLNNAIRHRNQGRNGFHNKRQWQRQRTR